MFSIHTPTVLGVVQKHSPRGTKYLGIVFDGNGKCYGYSGVTITLWVTVLNTVTV